MIYNIFRRNIYRQALLFLFAALLASPYVLVLPPKMVFSAPFRILWILSWVIGSIEGEFPLLHYAAESLFPARLPSFRCSVSPPLSFYFPSTSL